MTMADKDIQVLRRILSEAGKWLVVVHRGHIVKVARVTPDMSVDAVLDDLTSGAFPKSASCRSETR